MEFYLWCEIRIILKPFFLVCVRMCKCVYPHLTDLLSKSGAALRINTDTLSAHVHTHNTHAHTFTRTVSSVSWQSFLQLYGFSFQPSRWWTFRMKADPKSFWTSINPPVSGTVLYGAQVSQHWLPSFLTTAHICPVEQQCFLISHPAMVHIYSHKHSEAEKGLMIVTPIAHAFCSPPTQQTPLITAGCLSRCPCPVCGAPLYAYCKCSEELISLASLVCLHCILLTWRSSCTNQLSFPPHSTLCVFMWQNKQDLFQHTCLDPLTGLVWRHATLKPAPLLTVRDFYKMCFCASQPGQAPQPDWWRAVGMPFQCTSSGRVYEKEGRKCVFLCMWVFTYV